MEHAGHVAELVAIIVGLLLAAAATLALSERLRLPFTVLLVVVGIGVSQLVDAGLGFLEPVVERAVSPDVILFVFLPTLIFESAFQLDARQLRHNLLPVLTLAIPGLLVSTGIIGCVVGVATPLALPVAFLLGAILSATDPVAVVALFRELGAPRRLTLLVEGESLFNDATAIVLAKILTGVAVAGFVTPVVVGSGVLQFFGVFLGGILVGWILAVLTGLLLGRVESNPPIEISLTTILAYLSFLLAEELFHVSGVMATVAAAITLGGWGRTKISPDVETYLDHFWEYMAFVANALIFLLVGLRVDFAQLLASWELLAWTVVAMVASRAAVVYGLVPVASGLPGSDPIDWRYQTVMFWGGLRGAIALAIVLALPELPQKEAAIAVVTGAVLFTLLVQGLSIEKLVRALGLERPPLSDRVARLKGDLAAKSRALESIPGLQAGGLFSAAIAEKLRERCRSGIAEARDQLAALRRAELDHDEELRLLFLSSFATEKTRYHAMLGQGHLSEMAYRELAHAVDLRSEAVRHQGRLPARELALPPATRAQRLGRWIGETFGWEGLAERSRTAAVAGEYEAGWGIYLASLGVLAHLDEAARAEAVAPQIVAPVRACYESWRDASRDRLDQTAAQFPEFVTAMQDRLAVRMRGHAEREVIEEERRAGALPSGVAASLLDELAEEIRAHRGRALGQLHVEPEELLRSVPFFCDTSSEEFAMVARQLRPHTLTAGAAIISQGDAGDSLFLIARGVVRVSRRNETGERDLATLMAGDFFGEMALLHREPRTATCRAVTPCAVYELKRGDLDIAVATCPGIRQALEETDRRRRAELS